jgi:hypothetical protein
MRVKLIELIELIELVELIGFDSVGCLMLGARLAKI